MSDDNGPPDTRITDEQDDDDRLSLTVMIYLDLTDDNDDVRVRILTVLGGAPDTPAVRED